MIKLTMVHILINLTLVKLITQMMINIVILFASPVLPEPVIESLENLPLTRSPINTQQPSHYEAATMINLSPKGKRKRQQLKSRPTISLKAKIKVNSTTNQQHHHHQQSNFDHFFKVSTRKQSTDNQNQSTEITKTTTTTTASGEMLPSSPGNNNHHGNILINQSTVFLGGSCNPTTWRKDIAIPMLKALNITYYDPQKDHWEPELIELEDKAKKNAEVLFFVIDNQTRSIASMIEVSFIAATTKKLVLVIDLFPSLEPIINGEPISQYEHDILKGGRKLLMKLVERKGMPVFNQIPAALNYIPIMISRNQHKPPTIKGCSNSVDGIINDDDNVGGGGGGGDGKTDQTLRPGRDDPTLTAHHILTSLLSPYELTKVKEVYDSCTDMYTGCLSLLDAKLAYLMLTGNDLDDNLVHNLIEINLTITPTNNTTTAPTSTTYTSDNITKENYSSNQSNTININNNNNNLNHHHHHNHNHNHNHNHHHHQQQQQQQSTTNLVTSRNHQQSIVDSNHSNHPLNYTHHQQLNHHHLNDTNHHHLNHNHHQHHHQLNNNNLDPSTFTINFKQFCSLILNYLQSSNLLSKSTSTSASGGGGGGSHFININQPSTTTPPLSPTVNLLASLVNLPQLDDKCDNFDEIDSQLKPSINDNQFKDSLNNNNLTDSQRIKVADIYLGGSDNPKGWRSSIAIPLIDQSNLTYSMPNINSTIKGWDTTVNDLTKLESCQVLLFVIGGQRPELETMILATHYFGQKFKVVLCVLPIPLESAAQDNQISMAAIDDYNRGRAYLSEMARKENIEVFEDLEEAVKCAIKLAKSSTS